VQYKIPSKKALKEAYEVSNIARASSHNYSIRSNKNESKYTL
jgi:hypothetical protein